MDHNDRQAIESLFDKIARVEAQSGPRDPEAEQLIRDRINARPAAPYLMAQTIVIQEQALTSAQTRIQELEYQLSRRPSSGGFLSSFFGGGQMAPARPMARNDAYPQYGQPSGPWGRSGGGFSRQRGGGFLAAAAQTAVGVAGGVVLGNAISSMFAGGDADEGPEDNAGADDGGMDDSDI
ncbi:MULTISPECIES: DUF2076 domain-containing protein [unclassified Sinorhizobium]|uniref:DUF2076 domain-containing protein n=1 Tax=unclassified Sinorhizobium TaxID=2613772 RepID=UPI0035257D84